MQDFYSITLYKFNKINHNRSVTTKNDIQFKSLISVE